MVEIEIELRSSAIVARADIESLAYDGNDSSAFLGDSNDHLANITFLKAPPPGTVQILREPASILKKSVNLIVSPRTLLPQSFK